MVDLESKPWPQWPKRLPLGTRGADLPEYKFLENDEFYKEVIVECRAKAMNALCETLDCDNAVVLLAGGKSSDFDLYDTDVDHCPFRQEPYFRYLFGVNEPDCVGFIDLSTRQSVLLVPRQPAEYTKWCGEPHKAEWYIDRFGVDECVYTSDLRDVLKRRNVKSIYLLSGLNTDSGRKTTTTASFEGMDDEFKTDRDAAFPVLSECRVLKTPKEIQYLRVAMTVSSQAHVFVMRNMRPGMSERQLEAMFFSWCSFYGGARHCAYTCICASGSHPSILHYGHAGRPNDRITRNGDILLLDMGGEYRGYATDITCSFPVSGEFSKDQVIIYEAVLAAQRAVLKTMKAGVSWTAMHRLAERTLLVHLASAGLLQGGTVDDYVGVNLGAVFMPHGLGHMIGLAVHDVGGFTEEHKRLTEPGVCYLRTSRTLQAGMVLSVEPGCYFIDDLLDAAQANAAQACYLNTSVVDRFRGFGGVRLEDDVLVLSDGIENFTRCPRSIDDITEVMRLARGGAPSGEE